VHIPPTGLARFGRELMKAENLKALGNLLILVPFAAMFWALWQQNFSSWVLQADKMDRFLFGREWLPAQIQTVNPIFVLAMLPLFSYVVYPLVGKLVNVTPLRKFGAGLLMMVFAFLIVAWIQIRLDAGERPNISWQILAFLVLTAGEVMVSVTHLEFAYTQAPKSMKSLVMCTYLGSVALGNAFTAGVNFFIQNADATHRYQVLTGDNKDVLVKVQQHAVSNGNSQFRLKCKRGCFVTASFYSSKRVRAKLINQLTGGVTIILASLLEQHHISTKILFLLLVNLNRFHHVKLRELGYIRVRNNITINITPTLLLEYYLLFIPVEHPHFIQF